MSLARAPEVRHAVPDHGCAPPIEAAKRRLAPTSNRCARSSRSDRFASRSSSRSMKMGLWIIDQHVAHERVLFERILRQRAAQQVESQRLLMPLILELTPAQQAVFAEISDELAHNGFEAEPFGARSVAVKIAPAGVDASQVEHMLHEMLRAALARRSGRQPGSDPHPHRRLDRLPRRHQSQHAARAEQDGMAAGGTGQDRISDDLPARAAGGAALLDEGYSEGVQENLALGS